MVTSEKTVSEVYGSGHVYSKASSFLASLECELESLRAAPGCVGNFAGKKDGSLRNHGFEYVTQTARGREELVRDFKFLHQNLTFYEKHDPFSHRTSTHVHVNVSSLKMDHVYNMLLLYHLFEEFFFCMVKPARRDNIHCVLLQDTYLPRDYNKGLDYLLSTWSKYTAFNLKPVTSFGSVEFRHMHGTGDAEEINTWLHVLENLWKLCQKVQVNPETIMSGAHRRDWFDLLFFPSAKVMALQSSMPNIIKNALIDVKFAMN